MLSLEVLTHGQWACVNRVSLPWSMSEDWFAQQLQMLRDFRNRWEIVGEFGSASMRIAQYARRSHQFVRAW